MSSAGNHTFGTLSSAPDGSIVDHIFAHVRSVLLEFKSKSDENENAITNELCKALDFKKPPEYPYFFHHQNIEDAKENTSTDFAAFGTFAYAQETGLEDLNDVPALVKFEAKRLSAAIPKKREKEYVIGEYENGAQIKNSGGIERFKNERHGKDVTHAGIIAYVQTDTFPNWLTKINSWISDEIRNPGDARLTWEDADLLSPSQVSVTVSEYRSISNRLSGRTIALRHLWLNATTI
ncbi:MAG: hypothetical protein ACHQIM_03555 [Sphingobacteriales bacterium]